MADIVKWFIRSAILILLCEKDGIRKFQGVQVTEFPFNGVKIYNVPRPPKNGGFWVGALV